MTYVRKDLPAILTIHGDADPLVPYTHGTRLQAALQYAGVANELVTIRKGCTATLRERTSCARCRRSACFS